MQNTRITAIILAFLAIGLIIIALCGLISLKQQERRAKKRTGAKPYAGQNKGSMVTDFGDRFVNSDLQKIFDDSKNPWGITKAVFQAVRFGGLLIFGAVGTFFLFIKPSVGCFLYALAVLCVWYPMYYYRAIGKEREAEWCKMYEFVWVLKNNAMLYDPAKTYLNTQKYIAEHAPNDKELIEGFGEFYRLWNEDEIDEKIQREYNFSIPREITQIIFNMNRTGEYPEDQLNALRQFIVNTQNLAVEKTLSNVSGAATVYSLPFMMISVIVSLMVPMLFQILAIL